MLRRKLNERKEYLKSRELNETKDDKKQRLIESLKTNTKLPHDIRAEARELLDDLIYDTKTEEIIYSYPKIALTTSHSPSSSLKSFTKHMSLIFNGFNLPRGSMTEQQLYDYCISQEVTHLIIFGENKGNPSNFILSKFPNGPTYYFSLFNTKYQRRTHKLGEKAFLVIDNMNSELGKNLKLNLSLCFPKVEEANRVVSFINKNGTIAFRHCLFENRKLVRECEFDMKLYKVVSSTFNMDGDLNYALKSFMNSTKQDVLSEPKP